MGFGVVGGLKPLGKLPGEEGPVLRVVVLGGDRKGEILSGTEFLFVPRGG